MEDEILQRLHRIYKEASGMFGNENCYLTGSMAVYFLGKTLNINVSGIIPNDVDILVHTKDSFRNSVKGQPPQRSITYNKGTVDEYDIIGTYRKNSGIKVASSIGNETICIYVQKPKLIKDEYEDQKEDTSDSLKLFKINRNIEILEQIQSRMRMFEFEEVPPKKENQRGKDTVNRKIKF